jgi:hypothetical protein
MCQSWSVKETLFVGFCVKKSSAVNSKAESGVLELAFAAYDPERYISPFELWLLQGSAAAILGFPSIRSPRVLIADPARFAPDIDQIVVSVFSGLY